MNYIYMDNYRGFDDELVPISPITFLVGENSTGKSSFLKLAYLFSMPQFWFSPSDAFNDHVEMGGFDDIVSAWSKNKKYFRVGLLAEPKKKSADSFLFSLLEFGVRSGSPVLRRFVDIRNEKVLNILFERQRTKYKIMQLPEIASTKSPDLRDQIKNLIRLCVEDSQGYTLLPTELPPNPPVPILLSVIKTLEQGETKRSNSMEMELPSSILDLTWIAPIRSSPQRFYDGLKHSFSPEGEHTPFVLKRSLRAKSKSANFVDKLSKFGVASGLFESIATHSFGNSPQAPFEILVKFSSVDLNISNVGYGVSQVLPLLVEFLSARKGRRFAIQQPEVHLHPKAQAALGDLMFALAEDKNLGFIVETHSDFLIDRFRLSLSRSAFKTGSNVLFFSRRATGNAVHSIDIEKSGRYGEAIPAAFRDFFIKEDLALLDL